MNRQSCPACGGAHEGRLIADVRLRTPDGHPLDGGYPVVSCDVCGCGLADVAFDESYYNRYYATLAKYAGEGRSGQVSVEAAWAAEKSDQSARRVLDLLGSRDRRVLDLGCATGSLLSALERLGFRDLHGIDPAADAVAAAAERTNAHLAMGSFASLPDDLGTFDCVCLTGVLEHLWDVDAAAQALRRLVRRDGIVYIEVPDAGRYLDPYVAPFEDFNTEHVNHFSLGTLQRLAERQGFRVVREEATACWLTAGVSTALIAAAWQPAAREVPVDRRDDALEKELVQYARRSSLDYARINETLERALSGASEVILWGIGETSFKLLSLPSLCSRDVVAYVDSNQSRHALSFGGRQVTGAGEIQDSSVPIVISSLIRADSIVDAAVHLGLTNPLVRLDDWRSAV